jgi:hypothetical protein
MNKQGTEKEQATEVVGCFKALEQGEEQGADLHRNFQ